jgi:hypothetical protein
LLIASLSTLFLTLGTGKRRAARVEEEDGGGIWRRGHVKIENEKGGVID